MRAARVAQLRRLDARKIECDPIEEISGTLAETKATQGPTGASSSVLFRSEHAYSFFAGVRMLR